MLTLILILVADVELAAHAACRADMAARIAERAKLPGWMRPALSARICRDQAERATALREIAKERRYARTTKGGVIDLAEIHRLQGEVRAADERIADLRARLKALKVKPMGCKERQVQRLMPCVLGRDLPDCRRPPVSEVLELLLVLPK